MSVNLPGHTLYEFVRDDFINAWEAMVESGRKGGNFLFARQAMALLELSCRVAAEDPSPLILSHFSERLDEIESRYFTRLPGKVELPGGFALPSVERTPVDESLVATLFDLIRHGQAHQYQQIPVELPDGHYFGVSLTGVEPGKVLDHLRYGDGKRAPQRPQSHLSYRQDENGNLWLVVCPEVLFLDFRMAADRASVFSGGFDPKYLERPRRPDHYRFDVDELRTALRDSGHFCWEHDPALGLKD
jgi:hypothetical protein